jgi:hypothetical protein
VRCESLAKWSYEPEPKMDADEDVRPNSTNTTMLQVRRKSSFAMVVYDNAL